MALTKAGSVQQHSSHRSLSFKLLLLLWLAGGSRGEGGGGRDGGDGGDMIIGAEPWPCQAVYMCIRVCV